MKNCHLGKRHRLRDSKYFCPIAADADDDDDDDDGGHFEAKSASTEL